MCTDSYELCAKLRRAVRKMEWQELTQYSPQRKKGSRVFESASLSIRYYDVSLLVLLQEFHRCSDVRVHDLVVVDERHYLSIVGMQFFDDRR